MSTRIFVFAAAASAAFFLAGCTGPSVWQQISVDYNDCLMRHAEGVALGGNGSGMTRAQYENVRTCMAERGHPVPEDASN